jgi:hypothetical protein
MSRVDVWLRGPVEGIDPLLQPVAHAFLQVLEDVEAIASSLDENIIWMKQGSAASPGFHIGHLAGATDRLLTYARGKELNEEQISAMKAEKSLEQTKPPFKDLLKNLQSKLQDALAELRNYHSDELLQKREVGKAKLPSTVMGLLFHAAEHAQRHCGQLTTTLRMLQTDSHVN